MLRPRPSPQPRPNPLLAATAAALLLGTPALAQTPDFSGSWKLDSTLSDPPPQMGTMGGARPTAPGGGGGGGGRGMMTVTEMFITQLASRLTIDMKLADRNRTVSYYLDGSESRNPGMMDTEFVTVSNWVGNTVVTTGKNTVKTPMGEMTIETNEVRSLSEDGTTMTVEMTITSPRGTMKRKTVYRKG